MATPREYAEWIVANQSKKNSDDPKERQEFDTVAEAYRRSKSLGAAPTQEFNPESHTPAAPEDSSISAVQLSKFAPTPYGVGGGLSASEMAPPPAYAQTAAGMTRIAGPILAVPVSAAVGAGALATAGIGYGLGAISEFLAQNIGGEEARRIAFENRKQEIISSGQKLGLPEEQIIEEINKLDRSRFELGDIGKAGFLSMIGPTKAFKGTDSRAINKVVSVLIPTSYAAAGEAAGETFKRSLERGEFSTYKSLGELAKGVQIPAILGITLGASSIALEARAQRQARMNFFRDMGINPTLDMVIPEYAKLGAEVRKFDAKARQELLESEGPLLETFSQLFPEAVQSEKVREALVPYLGAIDAQRVRVRAAQESLAQAEQAYADAASRVETAPSILARMRNEIAVRKLNSVNERAREVVASQQLFGGAETSTAMREKVSNLIGDFIELRAMRGNDLFEAAGVPSEQGIFTVGELFSAVREGVKDKLSTDAAGKVLNAVMDLAQPSTGNNTRVTLNQVRELRGKFSEQFADLSNNPQALSQAESIASDAYASLVGVTEKVIGKKFTDKLPAYRQAVKYWADTSEALSSPYGKALMKGDPTDSTFRNLAENIANGNVSQVQSLERFLKSVADDAPEVADMARRQFDGALRNSVLQLATGELGQIEPRKLVGILNRFPEGVPIENLGFGPKTFIQDWANLFRQYNINNLTPAEFDGIFGNPIVRSAILGGQPADVTRPLAARIAFERDARMTLLEEAAGIRRDLKMKGRAQKLARDAKLDEAEQSRILRDLERDPVMMEFAAPKGGVRGETFGVKETASEGSANIINTIVGAGDRGRQFLTILKKNKPETAKLLEQRYMTERMNDWFVSDPLTPGQNWSVNKQAIINFFKPKPGIAKDTVEGFASDFVSPDRLKDLEKMAKVFGEIADITKTGALLSGSGLTEFYRAIGMTQSVMEGKGLSQATMQTLGARRLIDWIRLGRWRYLNALMMDKPFANAFWANENSILAALNQVGPGKAAYLLKAHPELATAASEEANELQSTR